MFRRTAHDALHTYGIDTAALRAVNNGFNTTYRVRTPDGAQYALRLGTNSLRDTAGLRAELAWIQALAADTDIHVAQPCLTLDQAPFVELWCEPLGKTISATLSHWLPGRIVGEKPTRAQLIAMGELIARLHLHTRKWQPPAEAHFPSLTAILMNSSDVMRASVHPALTPALRTRIARVIDRIQPQYEILTATQPIQPIHADIHGYNVLWQGQRLAVIDFDDAGMGWPIQDLAICAYHLRDIPGAEAHVRAGYARYLPLPEVSPAGFEAQLIARAVLIFNDVLSSPLPADAAAVPGYADRLARRIDTYLDTGIFQMVM